MLLFLTLISYDPPADKFELNFLWKWCWAHGHIRYTVSDGIFNMDYELIDTNSVALIIHQPNSNQNVNGIS